MYKVPALLLRDVNTELLPTYEYLRSLGLADDDLSGILRACAPHASARALLNAKGRGVQTEPRPAPPAASRVRRAPGAPSC